MIGTTGVRFAGADPAAGVHDAGVARAAGACCARWRDARVEAVALEVSQPRAGAAAHRTGSSATPCVFTNLSHDHLDYHGSMAAYLDAKLMLFDGRNGADAQARPPRW